MYLAASTSISSGNPWKIAFPHSLKHKILQIVHHANLGTAKTFEILQRSYYWCGAYIDTFNFVSSSSFSMTTKTHKIPIAPFQKEILENT